MNGRSCALESILLPGKNESPGKSLTENAHLVLAHDAMEDIDDSFYFYLVPVKKEDEREEIVERAKVEQVVREAMQSDDIYVVSRPMTIETNLSSRPVSVTLPLKKGDVTSGTSCTSKVFK